MSLFLALPLYGYYRLDLQWDSAHCFGKHGEFIRYIKVKVVRARSVFDKLLLLVIYAIKLLN